MKKYDPMNEKSRLTESKGVTVNPGGLGETKDMIQ